MLGGRSRPFHSTFARRDDARQAHPLALVPRARDRANPRTPRGSFLACDLRPGTSESLLTDFVLTGTKGRRRVDAGCVWRAGRHAYRHHGEGGRE